MAVFRSDQAQLTFCAEPVQGADIERFTTATVASAGTLAGDSAVPGNLSITVNNGALYNVGDFIRIGDTGGFTNSEVRRIEHINTHTLHLDRALAFKHDTAATVNVQRVNVNPNAEGGVVAHSTTGGRKYMTFIPGVYETVDVPDPEMAIEPRYFLGTNAKRNFYQAYKGQQTFTGSVADMVMLNGWPLRFSIGSVMTVPFNASDALAVDATARTVAAAKPIAKGDVIFTPAADYDSSLDVGDYIMMGYGTSTPKPADKSEVRKIIRMNASSPFQIEVDYPFMMTHAGSTPFRKEASRTYYKHYMLEKVDLDTVSWHIHMRDSAEDSAYDFDRRYVGGMIGSMNISAEEGGLLTCSWDTVPFMDMMHNQQRHSSAGTTTGYSSAVWDGSVSAANKPNMPGFAVMHKIVAADVNKLPTNSAADTHGTTASAAGANTEPYYFSRGSLKFSGQEFARVRSFSLSVTNNEEPRYYIKQRFGRHRGPTEIREQQREYTMTATVALPDTALNTANSLDSATALFKELLLEGDYGSDDNPNMKGFSGELEFRRGDNDRILIQLPGLDDAQANFTPVAPDEGGFNQGVLIRTAPHGITGDNPMQAELDILVRNMLITVEDNISVYP